MIKASPSGCASLTKWASADITHSQPLITMQMNGDWYAWGQQPTEFLEKWKLVANAVRAATTKTCDYSARLYYVLTLTLRIRHAVEPE